MFINAISALFLTRSEQDLNSCTCSGLPRALSVFEYLIPINQFFFFCGILVVASVNFPGHVTISTTSSYNFSF